MRTLRFRSLKTYWLQIFTLALYGHPHSWPFRNPNRSSRSHRIWLNCFAIYLYIKVTFCHCFSKFHEESYAWQNNLISKFIITGHHHLFSRSIAANVVSHFWKSFYFFICSLIGTSGWAFFFFDTFTFSTQLQVIKFVLAVIVRLWDISLQTNTIRIHYLSCYI